ncbi:cytochrome c family protein [soil metagenome]
MDSFEFNKMAGAVLGTALLVFGLNELRGAIYHGETPEKPGMVIDIADAATGTGTGTDTATAAVPLPELLAKADPVKGEAQHKACLACHDFAKGGPNKIGPNLFDVVERPIASHPDFSYSDAMKAHSADKWTYENLDKFLANPQAFAPKTKMTFTGIKRDQPRADLLAFLKTLSDSPKPFPTQ